LTDWELAAASEESRGREAKIRRRKTRAARIVNTENVFSGNSEIIFSLLLSDEDIIGAIFMLYDLLIS